MAKMSQDEIEYRGIMEETFKVKPTRKAVQYLIHRVEEVLQKLGVDVEKDEESVKMQMDLLGIFINSIQEDTNPSAAGIYISAVIKGDLRPYAYIQPAQVRDKTIKFHIYYWEEERLDEGKEIRIR